MRVADLVTASILMLLGGVVVYDAVRLGIGWGTDGPKSGFFPFWLGVLLLVMCAGLLVQAALRAESAAVHHARAARARPEGALAGGGHGRAHAVDRPLRRVGRSTSASTCGGSAATRGWPSSALAVGVPLVAFIIFEKWFLVPMPKGPLEAWLGY